MRITFVLTKCLETRKHSNKLKMIHNHIGLPRPLPIPPPGGPSCWDLGFLTVSSTDSIKQLASEAAVIAFILTTAGSQTQFSKLSAMSSLSISTPYHIPPAKVDNITFIVTIIF